jgi:putative membrane protein
LTNVIHAHQRVGHVRSTNAILPVVLLASLAAILLWSAVRPHDYFTWFLEVAPVLIAVPVLVATRGRFRFTALAYLLMWLHAVVLIVGGHYTYAEVPPGHWVRDAFDLSRNHYDRVGHFMQGFGPAIVAREVLVRRSPLEPGKWLFFLVTSVCLAISAGYELVEFAVAVGTGEAAEAFLGTQGDVWDTQIDMLLALVGAVAAQLLLGRTHDRQLASRD